MSKKTQDESTKGKNEAQRTDSLSTVLSASENESEYRERPNEDIHEEKSNEIENTERSVRKRKLSNSNSQDLVDCNKLTQQTLPTTDTSLLYRRCDTIHPGEGSQQSLNQSAAEMTGSDNNTSLPIVEYMHPENTERSDKRRKMSDSSSLDWNNCNKVTEPTPQNKDTSLSYMRCDMINSGESRQQSSDQSTAELTDPDQNTCLPIVEYLHPENTDRSDKKRKLSDSTTPESVVCKKLTEHAPPTTDNYLSYRRCDIVHLEEGSEQSSNQSAVEITDPDTNSSLAIVKYLQPAIPPKIYPDDSIWLYDVLNTIGANTLYRETRQQTGVLSEILESFKDKTSCHYMGGTFEGTDTPGESSDLDFMACVKMFSVIEDISNAKFLSLLIIRESYTHDGYVKLQLVVGGVPCTSEHWTFVDELFPDLETSRFFKIDTMQRILLFECTLSANRELFSRPTNKPADLTIGKFSLFKTDTVVSYRGKTWPSMANEWLSRDRKNGWPTKKNIKELKSLGFFVVRKGHPSSLDKDLEWRISLSLQERKLMFNLTDVQHKCYVILKIFNRNIIKLDCITTYHWKTCLFYVIEENNGNIWKKKLLWYCIRLCIRLMIKWVKCGICPNYFIPGENLFDGRLNISGKNKSEKSLEKMLYLGADCLLLVNQNNLCHYIRLRESAVCFQLLQTISKFDNNEALFTAKLSIIQVALDVFNHEILERYVYQANDETLTFIQFLCSTIYRIKKTCDDNTTEHTTREIKASLSFLLPNIYTCLASNISALAIKNQENVFRNFLLLVSYALFAQGGLPGRLKLISVLYAAKLYNDCERHIDTLNEVDIMHNPSLCRCRYIINDMRVSADNCFDTQQLNVSTCVSFLPTEILITPDAMQYEMFRYVGISLTEEEKSNVFGRWQYRAVVDSNVLFFLLKYLTKRKLEKVKDCEDAKISIKNLLRGRNVRHRDVANNILAWICCSELNTYAALCYSISSWKEMISTDLCLNITIKKMKQKQYLYNAAKIHAIVILYNTWFANKSPRIHFCYQCFCKSPVIKCSRCKVSTYCCELCKAKNRRIHEAACKIARSYHDH